MDFNAIKHLIFDYDGTIGDCYDVLTACFNHVFRHYDRPERTVDEIRPWIGVGLEECLRSAIGEGELAEAISIFRDHYLATYKEGSHLMPGAREVLDTFDGQYRMAVCSNKPGESLRNLAEHLDVARYFEVVLGAYDVPKLKPAPDMLIEVLARLDATEDDTLYIGDTLIDVEFADTCGIPYVLVLGGTGTREQLEPTEPVALLESITELPALLR